MADDFRTWTLTPPPFAALLASARFEELGTGRRGAVLTRIVAGTVPIVRTTTPYRTPARPFHHLHDQVAREIGDALACTFNNALFEHYTSAYASMQRHSDQALDLADDTWIAVYSCYRDPAHPSRRLAVQPKAPGGAAFELPLVHGGVVAFSLATNRRYTHAIALRDGVPPNDWLGITFRTSKTFVQFADGVPVLADGARLTLATEEERREFFRLRRCENAEVDFTYPALAYTISESDLWPPR